MRNHFFYHFSVLLSLAVFATSLYGGSALHLTEDEKTFLSKHPVITAHNEKDYPPYNFNKEGKAVGLSIDYMNLLAKKIGIKVKYVSDHEWSDFVKMLREGELDVMLNIRRTPQRDAYLSFTEPYSSTSKAIFTNDSFLRTLNDLKGRKVCVPKDFYIQYFLESYYPDILLEKRKSLLACIQSVSKEESVATIGSRAIIHYLIDEKNIQIKNEYKIPDRRLTVGLAIATSSKQRILRDILQKAMYSVRDDELSVIASGWLGLQDAYVQLSNKSIVKPFKNKRIVTMCNNPNWAPIEFAKEGEKNNIQGIAIDTLKILEKKLNVEFRAVPTESWEQSQAYLRDGKCEILPAAIETKKRKMYANFTAPYLSYKLAIITQKDKPFIDNLAEIAEKSVARKRGSGLIQKLKEIYPKMDIIETEDYRDALKKVADGDAYCTIATLPVASYFINRFSLKNLFIAGYIDMRYRLSIAVNKEDPALLRTLEDALSEITEYEHKEIYNRWVGGKLVEPHSKAYLWYLAVIGGILLLLVAYREGVLKGANKNLQKEIREKVQENLTQHQFIQEQAKMAALGEMIGTIAHQWRQPLNALGLSIQNLEYNYKDGLVDKAFIDKHVDKNVKTIKFMSQTIDDFRNFFKVDKIKEEFSLLESVEATFYMQSLYLGKNNIAYHIDGDDFKVLGLKSEFQQVVLSLISNAKEALLENREENREIKVKFEGRTVVFSDNGGGIPDAIIDRIFDSYFTTKETGIGIGLYMARVVIEEKMGGKMSVESNHGNTTIRMIFEESSNGE